MRGGRERKKKIEFTANERNMHYYKFLRSHNSLTKMVFLFVFFSPHGWSLLTITQKTTVRAKGVRGGRARTISFCLFRWL